MQKSKPLFSSNLLQNCRLHSRNFIRTSGKRNEKAMAVILVTISDAKARRVTYLFNNGQAKTVFQAAAPVPVKPFEQLLIGECRLHARIANRKTLGREFNGNV